MFKVDNPPPHTHTPHTPFLLLAITVRSRSRALQKAVIQCATLKADGVLKVVKYSSLRLP